MKRNHKFKELNEVQELKKQNKKLKEIIRSLEKEIKNLQREQHNFHKEEYVEPEKVKFVLCESCKEGVMETVVVLGRVIERCGDCGKRPAKKKI